MNEFEYLKNKEIVFALRKTINEIGNASMTNINSYLKGEGYSKKEIENILIQEDLDTENLIKTNNILRNILITLEEATLMNAKEFLIGEGYDEDEIKDILGEENE